MLKKYETKWHSPCESYLGAEETRPEPGVVKITARSQVEKFAERYKEELSGTREPIPAKPTTGHRPTTGMAARDEAERNAMKGLPFREMIGSANYPTRLCHPAMAYALNEVSQHVCDPGLDHFKILKIAADFLVTQKTEGLTFRVPEPGTRQLVLVTDANWAGDKSTRRSVDAMVLFLWGMPIAYGSKKQAWVARSSFESELGGACRGGGVARHICQILSGMGIMLELPIPVYIDNEGVVNGLSNVTHETSAKHIDTRMFWLKNDITFNIFELMHVQTADNLADVMTKPLTIGPFRKLIDDI
jgi:hypothetical protein